MKSRRFGYPGPMLGESLRLTVGHIYAYFNDDILPAKLVVI